MPILEKLTSGIRLAVTERITPNRSPAEANADEVHTRVGIGGSYRPPFTPAFDASDRLCGAPGCTSGWLKPWKNRRRPVFEGEWGCSTRCLETIVASAVQREFDASANGAQEEPHRHRVPLGLVLLAQGWITHPQLQSALAAQRASGQGRIGDWLTRHCGLPEERIARGLGVQWNCPVLTLHGFSPRSMALVMPKRFVAEFGLIPVRAAASSILYVAFQERLKPSAALALEQMSGLTVESGLLTATQLDSARSRLLAAETVPVRVRMIPDADTLTGTIVRIVEGRQPVMSRLVRMQKYYWLRIWMEESALPVPGAVQTTAEDTEDHVFFIT